MDLGPAKSAEILKLVAVFFLQIFLILKIFKVFH